MKKMRIIGIALFVLIILVSLAFLVSKYLINSGSEVVVSEESINLKGVPDPKRIAYETDNAIIKISNNAAKKYSLNQIKYYKEDLKKLELYLAGGNDESLLQNIEIEKNLVAEGEEFLNWLESQKNEEEINVSKTPYSNSKIVNFDYQISSALRAGEAVVYEKSTGQNIKIIQIRETREKNSNIIKTRYYLPDGRIFFESSSMVYDM